MPEQSKEGRRTALPWLWLSAAIVIVDYLSKQMAEASLTLYQPVPVWPFFNLTLMYNYGAAFSFLSDAGGWQRWFFAGLAGLVSIVIIWWLKGTDRRQRLHAIALALILGGALGNLWDRLLLGYVVDFLDVYYASWHWPAFNVADSAITVGAVLMVLDALRGKQDKQD